MQMSYADEVFIKNCKDILENGIWDTDREVRPRWDDGTPAHTIKKFCIVNRYDLQKEFPALTLRKTFIKRPKLANVTQLALVMSLKNPKNLKKGKLKVSHSAKGFLNK